MISSALSIKLLLQCFINRRVANRTDLLSTITQNVDVLGFKLARALNMLNVKSTFVCRAFVTAYISCSCFIHVATYIMTLRKTAMPSKSD